VRRYQSKLSGPILDRIDLRIEVGVPPAEKVGVEESAAQMLYATAESQQLRLRIAAARERQRQRYESFPTVHCNAQLTPEVRRTLIRPRREAMEFLRRAMSKWHLSVRAFDRALAVGRTIADLEGASDIDVQHVAEALQYRVQDSVTPPH
jgi:magnesium chelatase family protein